MLRNRNIAFFIDVDNVDLTSENFDSIIAQLEGMGQVLTGKVYGAKERKHKAIFTEAELRGYKIERPMRIKRRGRRDFDSRIFVDVVDTVCRAPSIDAVCVVTASCDLVYLYSYLHGKGIKVISSDENEEASSALVDEYVDLGRIYEIPLPEVKPAVKKVKKTATRPAVATATRSVARARARASESEINETSAKDDKTNELLREIERLKRVAEEQEAEKEAKSKAAEEARRKAQEAAEKAEAEAKARAEERERARLAIEEAKAKAREEAEAKAREEERQKAQKAIEEAKAKAREEAEAKAREEERQRAQKEIEEARRKAREEAEARAREEERAKAEEQIRLKLAELAKTGGNNDELMRELEKLKSLTSETNQLVKQMKDEPKEQPVVVRYDTSKAEEEAKTREEERLRTQRLIEEAKAKARQEAEARVREQTESKAEAEARARAEEREMAQRAREEERAKAQKDIEEAKAKAREEEAAKVRAEERERAQKEIEEARKKAQEAADKAKAEEEERQRAQREIEHWRSLAEQQADEPDSPSAKYYMQRTDGKLLRKIEEINNGESKQNDDELLATIQNLLDGLDD